MSSRGLRILALCNCPLDESLGSGYVSLRYAEGLRAAGHQVDLLGPADYEPLHGRFPGRGLSYRQAVGMAVEAVRRSARGDYDLVEICGAQGWLAMLLLTRTARRRFLVVQRSNGLETHCEDALRRAAAAGVIPRGRWFHLSQSRLFEAALRRVDGLVTVSAADRDWALARGYAPPDRILAIENSLPDSYLGQAVDPERPRVFGYCGSWLPVKGVDLLVRAMPAVLRDLPGWRLALVGVGDGFRAAEHFPADVLPQIDVVPRADRMTRLRELYRGFAVSILPSVYESFGLAAAEAMACGSALVATRVGFAAGLRDREEALLLPDRSPEALAGALRELATDEPLRRAVASGGYRRVQELRWERAVRTLGQTYAAWGKRHV
jgi:glycosyltransferase involved in cell wall biosynthesis